MPASTSSPGSWTAPSPPPSSARAARSATACSTASARWRENASSRPGWPTWPRPPTPSGSRTRPTGRYAEARGPRQREHLDLARTERANIDAALTWCATHDPALGVRIVLGFGWTWVMLGTGVEGAHRVRRALDSASPGAQERTRALILCGWFEASGGNLDQARTDLEDGIALGDQAGAATARLHLAFIHTQGGRAPDALTVLEQCRPQLTRQGLTWEEGTSWLLAAWAHITQGDVAAAEDACLRALAVLQPLGDGWALAHAEGLLGELALAQQQFPEAVARLTNAAHSAGMLGFEAAQAHHLLNLGRAELQSGDADVSAGHPRAGDQPRRRVRRRPHRRQRTNPPRTAAARHRRHHGRPGHWPSKPRDGSTPQAVATAPIMQPNCSPACDPTSQPDVSGRPAHYYEQPLRPSCIAHRTGRVPERSACRNYRTQSAQRCHGRGHDGTLGLTA